MDGRSTGKCKFPSFMELFDHLIFCKLYSALGFYKLPQIRKHLLDLTCDGKNLAAKRVHQN